MLNFSVDSYVDDRFLTISFFDTDEADLPDLLLNVVEIDIQIAPGWVV